MKPLDRLTDFQQLQLEKIEAKVRDWLRAGAPTREYSTCLTLERQVAGFCEGPYNDIPPLPPNIVVLEWRATPDCESAACTEVRRIVFRNGMTLWYAGDWGARQL